VLGFGTDCLGFDVVDGRPLMGRLADAMVRTFKSFPTLQCVREISR